MMTEAVRTFLQTLKVAAFRDARRVADFSACPPEDDYTADAARFVAVLEAEEPFFLDGDPFGFNRTVRNDPELEGRFPNNNITPDYASALEGGFDGLLRRIRALPASPWREAPETEIAAVYRLSDRYRDAAKQTGRIRLYDALGRVPRQAPTDFFEACVMMKIIIFTLRKNITFHLGLGRFDQYMLPYFLADRARGVSEAELFETLELFFISLNVDIDLYWGMQRGDDGQSMMLGGYGADGEDMFNPLSEMCIRASEELCLIDPKINLRVNRTTPIERYELGTELTRKGLGFPQYCNDDIVVPGLIRLGYAPEDAREYTVAACWEFIIPGKGMDIVNATQLVPPKALEKALQERLTDAETFDAFQDAFCAALADHCRERMAYCNGYYLRPRRSPYCSLFFPSCLERGRDVADGGAVYYNFGLLVSGLTTAADSLAAIKRAIYDERFCTKEELLTALRRDFAGDAPLRNALLACPKTGNDDDEADRYLALILRVMDKTVSGQPNVRGGIFRVGTGSAQGYHFESLEVGATPDGRKAGTPYSSSFSPSLQTRLKGPLSCIRSFTKVDMTNTVNGGPLTMEIHDSVFRNDDGVPKVARLVQCFIERGGHQLQLNAVNRDVLLAAKARPEEYRNLIVRVWGWSGYFTELDPWFQEHIIARTEFTC
mgnify:CR=1 FL=1